MKYTIELTEEELIVVLVACEKRLEQVKSLNYSSNSKELQYEQLSKIIDYLSEKLRSILSESWIELE
jgi:hypothetical protein